MPGRAQAVPITRLPDTGLSTEEARRILARIGTNVLPSAKPSRLHVFAKWLFSPIPLMLIAACALSYASGKKTDAGLILFLLLANYLIQLWHEYKADKAVEKLEEHLAFFATVLRDGVWKRIPTALVVPGDRIALRTGSIIPADARILSAENLSSNESTLTGESLPKEKVKNDIVYSAAYIATGAGEAVVTNTGARTYFGKAIQTIELAKKRSALEEDILSVSKFLAGLSIIAILILSIALYLAGGDTAEIATLDISLLIAGIPVALPTVMSLIISAGVIGLAGKGAIVRRLSALEDLANVNLLLSDKTGTLTENKIRVTSILPLAEMRADEALRLAASATDPTVGNPLEAAIREAIAKKDIALWPQTSLIPADSERKRSTATVKRPGTSWLVTLGAPPTVAEHARFSGEASRAFEAGIKEAARRGDRALLLAGRAGAVRETGLTPLALIFLADQLRADAREMVAAMHNAGIEVKMLSGDGLPIMTEVAHELGLTGELYGRDVFDDRRKLARILPRAAGFAEVLPKDKYRAVEVAKKKYRVAVTGDGANDIPPVADADVGIAVAHSVDALRESADIVLLTNGLFVIATAIREARKVFMRLYHYSLYRISESSRLIVTIAVIGVIAGTYPLTPIQVLLLAFLNDVPIISIAFDRVKIPRAPRTIHAARRALLSFAYGATGVANSLLMLWLAVSYLHLPWPVIQTLFFLKLVVSGHLLMYVAHTEQRWFRWFPSWQVIIAISATQLLATAWAFYGFYTTAIPLSLIAFVWLWSFFWMQVADVAKTLVGLPFRKPTQLAAA